MNDNNNVDNPPKVRIRCYIFLILIEWFYCVTTVLKRFKIPSPVLLIQLILIVSECSQMDMDGFRPDQLQLVAVILVGCGWLQVVADGLR